LKNSPVNFTGLFYFADKNDRLALKNVLNIVVKYIQSNEIKSTGA